MLFKIKIPIIKADFHKLRLSLYIFLNYDPGLTMLYYMARSDFALKILYGENMTFVDSLEILLHPMTRVLANVVN